MGKKGAWQQPPWKQGSGHGSDPAGTAWAYWPGAWRNRPSPKQNKDGKDESSHATTTVTFPSYSQVSSRATDGQRPPGQDADVAVLEGGDPFVRNMQRLLNVSRKTEAKIRKLQQDKVQKRQQWDTFQEQLKAAFVEQRHKFQADTSKLDAELVELEVQRRVNAEHIQASVSGGRQELQAPSREVVPSAEDAIAWHQLMMATPAQEAEQDAILQQALRAAQHPQAFLQETVAPMLVDSQPGASRAPDAGVAGPPGPSASGATGPPACPPACMTPVRAAQHAPPRTPAPPSGLFTAKAPPALSPPPQSFYVGDGDAALSDPYLTSPGAARATRPALPMPCSSACTGSIPPTGQASGAVLLKAAVRANSRSAPYLVKASPVGQVRVQQQEVDPGGSGGGTGVRPSCGRGRSAGCVWNSRRRSRPGRGSAPWRFGAPVGVISLSSRRRARRVVEFHEMNCVDVSFPHRWCCGRASQAAGGGTHFAVFHHRHGCMSAPCSHDATACDSFDDGGPSRDCGFAVQGPDDGPPTAAGWFELWFLMPLEAAVRSFLLLQTLAFGRFIAAAFKLWPAWEKSNMGVRLFRAGLRGAPLPLCTAFGFALSGSVCASISSRPRHARRQSCCAIHRSGQKDEHPSCMCRPVAYTKRYAGWPWGYCPRILLRLVMSACFLGECSAGTVAAVCQMPLQAVWLLGGHKLAYASGVDAERLDESDDDVGVRADSDAPSAAMLPPPAIGGAAGLELQDECEVLDSGAEDDGPGFEDDEVYTSDSDPKPADWQFCATVLQFEGPMLCWACRADVHSSMPSLCGHVSRCFARDGHDGVVMLVEPQPSADCAVFLSVGPRQTSLGQVPVCLQAYVRGSRERYFQAFLDSTFNSSDLIDVFGELYRPGYKFFLGENLEELDHLDSFQPRAGMLIRALPSSLNPRPCIGLSERLGNV